MKPKLIFFLTLFVANIFAQEANFSTAQKLLKQERFHEALPLWQQLASQNSDNANYQFKLGLCLYFSKANAVEILKIFQQAASNVKAQSNFNTKNEKHAPWDAYYFLGAAYLHNNKIDSAIHYFALYEQLHDGNPPMDANREIYHASNALKNFKKPRIVKIENVSSPINTSTNEIGNVVGLNKSIIYFATNRDSANQPKQYYDIYFSSKKFDNTWSQPLPFQFNSEKDEIPLCLSADSKTLYFTRKDKKVFNIYYCTLENDQWSEPKSLKGINKSNADDKGFALSADGNYAIISSNRSNGFGGFDLYHTTKKQDGTWNKLKNLGKEINSASNEITPFLHPTSGQIFYSSNGYRTLGMGGYDIYYVDKTGDNEYSLPITLGFPINTTGDDLYFYLGNSDRRYYSSYNPNGSYDIFSIDGSDSLVAPVQHLLAVSQNIFNIQASVEDRIVEVLEIQEEVVTIEEVETKVGQIKVDEIDNVDKLVGIEEVVSVEQVEVEKEIEVVKIEYLKEGEEIPVTEADKLLAENTMRGNTEPEKNMSSDLPKTTFQHRVEPGQTLYSIAKMHGMTVDEVKNLNNLQSNYLKTGQLLTVQASEAEGSENAIASIPNLDKLNVKNLPESERKELINKVKDFLFAEIKSGKPALYKTVYFQTNSKQLSLLSLNELKVLVDFLNENPKVNIEILGHTDSQGSWDVNFWISRERAYSVFNYLVENGVSKKRMIYNGKGSTNPIASNETKEGRNLNRRVEIILLGN
jgi:outer membrane protein OmpA-like peptidoglycan-associated protein/tetratricopeptide (TPR) repeat protein